MYCIYRTTIIGYVWHTCTAGARFTLKTYGHWKVLVLRGSELTVHSKEGVKQGETLVTILCGLGVLLLIQALHHHVLDSKHHRRCDSLKVWYVEESTITPPLSIIK